MAWGLLLHAWIWFLHLVSSIKDSESTSYKYRKVTAAIVSIGVLMLLVGFVYVTVVIGIKFTPKGEL